ncbi:MAG: dockerin type I domain-containing protein, partial [Planctomycetota bacterium]
ETLESRQLLDAAVWHNVLNRYDTNASGGQQPVTPIDALVVINEFARNSHSQPGTGVLNTQIDDGQRPPFYDVNCDGSVTPLDALQVINTLASGRFQSAWTFEAATSGGVQGNFEAAGCHARLNEGQSLRTELTSRFVKRDAVDGVRVMFDAPQFDSQANGSGSQGMMQDAFEIIVTDTEGNIVTQPYRPGRTASFNWSEQAGHASGIAVQTTAVPEVSADTYEVIFNLAHLPDDEEVIVTARLINNDQDENTSVVIRELSLVSDLDQPPLQYESETRLASSSGPVQLSALEDVSGSMVASYGRTSYTQDRSQVITELTVTNRGNQAVTGRMIIVLDRFTDLDTAAMHPDGLLPDGRAYFDMTDYVDDVLEPGESTRPRTVRFTNPGDQRFAFRLITLGDLNNAPGGFVSEPLRRIEAEAAYRYTAIATDDDVEQELTYEVVSGPAAMDFVAGTNDLVWQTGQDDIGSHRVVIRATDPFGLFVEQTFDVEVVATLQNRPPNFVSDPVTEAIASSG